MKNDKGFLLVHVFPRLFRVGKKGFWWSLFFRKPRDFAKRQNAPIFAKAKIGFSQKGFLLVPLFRKPFSQKGFLGPIGDDLPSLIPLVFALIIFFGAFGVTFNTFNQRGRDFDLQIEALRISTDLKGNSYFANYEQFRETCDSINARGTKFRGGLVEFGKFNSGFDVFNPEFYSSAGTNNETNVFKCENTDEELSRQRMSQQNPITRDFPVALNDNFTVKPMSLVITVWK